MKEEITLTILEKEINKHITDNVTEIRTNGNIASILQDSIHYTILPLDEQWKPKDGATQDNLYKLGKLNGIQIVVDSQMRWADNVLHLKNENEIIKTINIP